MMNLLNVFQMFSSLTHAERHDVILLADIVRVILFIKIIATLSRESFTLFILGHN